MSAMTQELVTQELQYLAGVRGVRLCALVDSETGMIWLSAGQQDGMEGLLESARDYWRVHRRHGLTFDHLGDALGLTVRHEHALLNVTPCGPDLVLVTLAEPGGVHLRGWSDRLVLLRSRVQALLRPSQPVSPAGGVRVPPAGSLTQTR
jgi:hypothetical protein